VKQDENFRSLEDNVLNSLCMISLQRESQPIIFQAKFVNKLISLIALSERELELLDFLQSGGTNQFDDSEYKEPKKFLIRIGKIKQIYDRILKWLIIITNCLMFRENWSKMFTGQPFQSIKNYLIENQDRSLENSFTIITELNQLDDSQSELKSFIIGANHSDSELSEIGGSKSKKVREKDGFIMQYIKAIKSEAKVALLLIENSKNIKSVS